MKKLVTFLMLCCFLLHSSALASLMIFAYQSPPPVFQPYEIILMIVMGLAIIHLYSSFITRHIYKEKSRPGGYVWGLLLGLFGIAVAAVKTKERLPITTPVDMD